MCYFHQIIGHLVVKITPSKYNFTLPFYVCLTRLIHVNFRTKNEQQINISNIKKIVRTRSLLLFEIFNRNAPQL